jgi:hypothetical protein
MYVVAPSTPDIDPPPDFSIPFCQPHTRFTIHSFTAVNMPEQSSTPPHVFKEAPSSAAVPSSNSKEIPKNPRKRKIAPPEFDPAAFSFCTKPPLRQLPPKPTPSATEPGRRDSVIDNDENLIPHNVGPTPGSTSGSTGRTKSRPTKPKTSTNTNIPDDQDEPIVPPPDLQEYAKPSSTHKRTKVNAANREYQDHRRGLHDGRDSYGLASMPYLNAGLPLPWGPCEECEKEKKTYTEM